MVRRQYAAGITLFLIGLVVIGVGLPSSPQTQAQSEPILLSGVNLVIVGLVLAVFGYSEKNE